MSAILSTAYTIVEPDYMDINSFKLELPKAVTTRLKSALLPYLQAIGLSGFEKWKRRKAFIVGNTGKHTIFVLLCFDSIHRISYTHSCFTYLYIFQLNLQNLEKQVYVHLCSMERLCTQKKLILHVKMKI